MKKRLYNLNGLKFLASGLALMAIGNLALDLVEVYKQNVIFNIGNTVMYLLGFLLIIVGSLGNIKYRREFRMSLFYAIAGAAILVLQGILVLKQYKIGTISVAYTDFMVMFVGYMATICMLLVYHKNIMAISQLFAKYGEINVAKKNIRTKNIGILVVWLCLLLLPFAHIFKGAVGDIFVLIVVGASFVFKIIMTIIIERGYRLLHGRAETE